MKKKKNPAIRHLRNRAAFLMREWNRPEHLFRPDKEKAVFIVIDMQNFCCSPREGRFLQSMDDVIRNINLLADHCHKEKIPVIWIRQSFNIDQNKSDAGLYPLFHRRPLSEEICNGSRGTEIYEELHFDRGIDCEVIKNRYSPFATGASNINEILRTLERNQLLIAGLAANVCVESTARDAMQRDYEVILLRDATAAFDEILFEATLTNIGLFFGDVRRTYEVLDELECLPARNFRKKPFRRLML